MIKLRSADGRVYSYPILLEDSVHTDGDKSDAKGDDDASLSAGKLQAGLILRTQDVHAV